MKKFRILYLCLIALSLISCASSDNGKMYITKPREPANYRAHPASYLVDRFPVQRQIDKHEAAELPFYFKKCSRSVGNYMGTNTAYDCD